MKKPKRLITAFGLAAAVLGISVGVAMAAANNTVVQGTTNRSIYKAGQDVNITGTVNGDVFCAGQTVTIDATVNGDVICAGQNVTVNGTVNGSVRLAGQTVTVGADIKHAASLAGQDVTFQSNAAVANDLGLAAQTATVDGPVGRDITGSANTISLNGTVGRNVDATVGNKLELQKNALVKGGLTYTGPRVLHSNAGSQVLGTQTYHRSQVKTGHSPMNWGFWWAWHVYWGVAVIVFSLVLAALFPQLFDKWNKVAKTRPWHPLLVGFAAMFLVPVLVIALFITIVGVPLGLFVGLLWITALALSAPLAAYYAGSLIMPGDKRILLIMLVGAVVLTVACGIPVIGWIIAALAYWFGAGVLLLNLRRAFAKPNYRAS